MQMRRNANALSILNGLFGDVARCGLSVGWLVGQLVALGNYLMSPSPRRRPLRPSLAADHGPWLFVLLRYPPGQGGGRMLRGRVLQTVPRATKRRANGDGIGFGLADPAALHLRTRLPFPACRCSFYACESEMAAKTDIVILSLRHCSNTSAEKQIKINLLQSASQQARVCSGERDPLHLPSNHLHSAYRPGPARS